MVDPGLRLDNPQYGILKRGDAVNLEVDLIGKYVEKLLMAKQADGAADRSGINTAFLAENGFLR